MRNAHQFAISFVVAASAFAFYIAILLALDTSRGFFSRIGEIASLLPILAVSSIAAYLIRFVRWRLLLREAGYDMPVARGFLAYASGFAFTISPGKVGELVRIRYFAPIGIPHDQTIACFILEHVLDLLVVLSFASLIAFSIPAFGFTVVFVWAVVAAVAVVTRSRRIRAYFVTLARRVHLTRVARVLHTLGQGFEKLGQFLKPTTLVMATGLGALAWGSQALGFAVLLHGLSIPIPVSTAFAIFPAATIVGAASMVPGGIGSTEAAFIVLLAFFGAPLDIAALAAIAVRLGTLWFSVLLGIAAIVILEWWYSQRRA